MSETSRLYNEIDDYMAAFSGEERQEYTAAETALNLIIMLYRTWQEQGPRQQHAAARTGLKRQAISHLEKAASTMQFATLQPYLSALEYRNETGN